MVRKQPAGKDIKNAKGFAIEEALRIHFARQGIFAVRSVPYRLEGDDVTDIDLWLYEGHGTTARRRTIVDIKYKRSPQAAERLIWTKGLQTALGVEAALIATTDRRLATQRLARSLKVGLIDFAPFNELVNALGQEQTLLQSEFENSIRNADSARKTTEWRDTVASLTGSLLTGLGFASSNRALITLARIYDDASSSPPTSDRAQTGGRIIYYAAAIAAISLDYALSDSAYRSKNDRVSQVINGLRFGGDANAAMGRVRAGSALIEKYLPNGRQLAKTVESAFLAEAENLPAEIVAEYVSRGLTSDTLFQPSLALLNAALSKRLPTYDELPTGAKGLISVFLDFSEISREAFAKLWQSPGVPPAGTRRDAELPLNLKVTGLES